MRSAAAPTTDPAAEHPHVRVTAPSLNTAVQCAGAAWAGISEVPTASLTEAQLAALKADSRLQVEEISRPLALDAAPSES